MNDENNNHKEDGSQNHNEHSSHEGKSCSQCGSEMNKKDDKWTCSNCGYESTAS